MNIATVSYEDFSTSNQATVEEGGPWIVQSDVEDNVGCSSESQAWCGGYCLSCEAFPRVILSAFHPSFVTNISVNLADYGGATILNYIWNYWPLYCGSNFTAGSYIPITSQVGDTIFEESFPTVNYTAFFKDNGGRQWDNASKTFHNGSTSLMRGSDPNRGYIVLNIAVGFHTQNYEENLNFYVMGIGFLITTPLQSAAASSSSTSTQQGNGYLAQSSSGTSMAMIVVGAVVGALAFVVLFILAVCLFRRRRKKGESPVDDTVIFTEQVNHETPIPLEVPVSPPHLNTRYHSAQPSNSPSLHPAPFVARGSYGPPPTYGPDDPTGQDRSSLTTFSPELALFAAVNRGSINESLEARLQATGYVPTQDPSKLTPDEWKNEYGVTKLELKRLQTLYARNQQVQPQ